MENPGVVESCDSLFAHDAAPHRTSLFRRLAINHAHPTKFLLDLIGFVWLTYFLWQNNFVLAVIAGVGFAAFGSVLTIRADTENLKSTSLGKYVLARLHPANLTFQVMGYIVSMYGVWVHEGWIILIGASSIILGHLWGWGRKVMP